MKSVVMPDQNRRVVHGGAYQYVVYVRPPAVLAQDPLEHAAVMSGYIGVIDGQVVEPGSQAARSYQERYLAEAQP